MATKTISRPKAAPVKTRLDPITFAVVRNALISAAREIYWVFKRTTMLPVLYEYNDFGMSIYDDRLNLIAEAPGLPIFVGSLDDCIERTIQELGGLGNLKPGDILLNNHPYLTAGQPADAALMEPIFHSSRLIGFGALRAHMGDLGAMGPYPTNATEVFQEGLLLPAVKLYQGGRIDDTVLRIIRANSRMPDETAGNILAAAGALRAGSRALLAVVEKYGLATYYATIDELLDHGERIAREGIRRIPDGRYAYEDVLDDDGVVAGVPVPLKVTVTVSGSELTLDTSGSAQQQTGPVNCPWGYTLTTARFSLKRLVTSGIPANSGEHRPLKVIAPEGSVFNPVAPAASFISWVTSLRLSDMVLEALAPALPEDIPAQNGGDLTGVLAYLRHPETGRLCFFWDDGGVGHGAKKGRDGMSALIHPISAGIEYLPTELLETRMPILRRLHQLRRDSGGPGQFRGGLAAEVEYELQAAGVAVTICDKSRASKVRGLAGGMDAPDKNSIIMFPGTKREACLGKKSDIFVQPGDVTFSKPAGGGGYGNPRKRDPKKVAWDVQNDYVSREAARKHYGVVVSESGELDAKATARLRARKQR
jgi:N-methylhydantoinase B